MKETKNLVGQKFGKWTVLSRADDWVSKYGQHCTRWNCICDCGAQKIVKASNLLSGKSKSCGCNRVEIVRTCGSKNKKEPNCYKLNGEYGVGYVVNKNQSVEFYFDLQDYSKIKKYRWKLSEYGYVICGNGVSTIRLHRIILDATKNQVVDHIDRNPLNNRRSNLRISSDFENAQNRSIPKVNKSGCAGVCKKGNKRQAALTYRGNRYFIGYYKNIEDAIMARLLKEVEICDDLYHRANTELLKKYNLIK